MRRVAPRARIEGDVDLTPVALLAALEPLRASENPRRRPIAAVRQGDVWSDGDGQTVGPAERVAEPAIRPLRVIEGQESKGPIGKLCEERLRAAAGHKAAPNDLCNAERAGRPVVLHDREDVIPTPQHRRGDNRILKADRHAIERSNDTLPARWSARASMGGAGPGGVFLGVAPSAGLSADEIVEDRFPRWRRFRWGRKPYRTYRSLMRGPIESDDRGGDRGAHDNEAHGRAPRGLGWGLDLAPSRGHRLSRDQTGPSH